MSGSDNPQFFPVEKEDDREDIIKLGKSLQPMSENLGSCPEMVSEAETAADEEKEKGNLDRADHQKETAEEIKNEEETDKTTDSYRESEKQISEDDDGFKTPTSSDHRIPAIVQCPPAPTKPRPQPSKLKRKASPLGDCLSLQLDASTEVESIFLPIISNDQDNTHEGQKIKKARRDDKDRS